MTQDYERIARAIDFIRQHVGHQPSLAEIAAHVHLSEYHFQRLFSRWAGITPKRYLQALTLERAKQLLRQPSHSTLSASYELGLSSGSRLYDHFVQLEAVTPFEYRQQGLGISIAYGYHPTPFGLAFIAQTARGICQFDFVDMLQIQLPLERLKQSWSQATIYEDTAQTASLIDHLFSQYFADTSAKKLSSIASSTQTIHQGEPSPLSLWVKGTNFQLNVWRALLNLPKGEVASYGDIAKAIGKPKASRAVGTAIGANPVALLIPCHRVLRQTGELGGYRWGETRKHAILAREAAYSE